MNIFISGDSLPSMKGTFLQPESHLDKEWNLLKEQQDVILVLTEGPSSAALAFKVWPDLIHNVKRIVYAGGTLKRGDSTPYAEASIYKDPHGMESLLNTGVPVIFCTIEAAIAHNMTMKDLALGYARNPEGYRTVFCGVHVETQMNSIAYGKMICDVISDNKFEKKNAHIVMTDQV